MDADPDRDRLTGLIGRPGAGRLDDREPAQDGAADRREGDVEAVALGLDLGPVVLRDRLPDDRPIAHQELRRVGGTVGLDVMGVVAQVGEQEATGGRRRRP